MSETAWKLFDPRLGLRDLGPGEPAARDDGAWLVEGARLEERVTASTFDFLRAVHPQRDGWLAIQALAKDKAPRQVEWIKLPFDEMGARVVQAYARASAGYNLYHRVASYRDAAAARLPNASTLAAIFVEIDLKRGVPLLEVWNRLLDCPLAPSVIVHSGGGLHVYWLLAEPLDLQAPLGAERAYHWLHALAARVGGEPESREPNRLLRIPGTPNVKPEYGQTPPMVMLIDSEWNARYSAEEIVRALGDADPGRPAAPIDPAAQAPIDHGLDAAARLKLARAWLSEQPPAVEGDGGDARTYAVACAVAVGHDLSEDGAIEALDDWNARCQPEWSERELRQKVRNAIRYATEQRGARLADYPRTDSGNAEFFADRHGDRVCHDHARRQWFWFDGQRWAPNRTAEVDRLALEAVRRRQALALLIADTEKRKAALRWATESENRTRRDHLMACAAKVGRLAVSGDEWDPDPWLLGVANGVVDLRTGALRDGRPGDRVTKSAPPAYDPAARAPRFERFMEEVFADHRDLPGYLQRCLGYALTGVTTEQAFWILYGEGANGKSTLIEAVFHHVLGDRDYAWAMPFPEAGWSNAMSEYQKAGLVGRRLVTASEVKRRGQINEELVKSLTGDDTINARHPYGRPFQFRPVAKFFLRVNAKPIIRDETHGMWRRVKLVPFTQTFGIDKSLPATLASEAPGILAWAVRGCLEWQRGGLREPEVVRTETEEYRKQSDPLADFIAERCVAAPGKQAGGQEAFRAYCQWCDARHLPADARLNQTAFGSRMKERFPDVGKRTVVYSGLGLLATTF